MIRFDATGPWIRGQPATPDCPLPHRPNNNRSGQLIWYINRSIRFVLDTERLVKDRERLLTFYDFPAEHWKHIRTSNPIESTFATVRQRTVKTKGCLSRKTALAMTFKLILSAKRKWRKLDGSSQLAELIEGVPFKDGIKQIKHAA